MNTPSDNSPGSHYFSESPTTASRRSDFTIQVGDRELTLSADAGVFSQHGLDKGTAVLLDSLRRRERPHIEDGSIVCDLGCGSGAIALALAVLFPHCTVLAVDVNERARQLCSENAERNKITNIRVAHPDDVAADTSLELLWSNPPIRIGKSQLRDMLTRWLSRLSSTGRAHLVVSKNLGADSLTDWLNSNGFTAHKLSSSKGFRVVEVKKT